MTCWRHHNQFKTQPSLNMSTCPATLPAATSGVKTIGVLPRIIPIGRKPALIQLPFVSLVVIDRLAIV